MSAVLEQNQRMRRYYQLHARIYDATRWSFLFGRQAPLRWLQQQGIQPQRILEIGCGTGSNLAALARAFPHAELVGVDISPEMLKQAHKRLQYWSSRVQLLGKPYQAPLDGGFDLVLCSYSLSMINPGWENVLQTAKQDLKPGGYLAVVDFHDSTWLGFSRWMAVNHVRMQGQLLPQLDSLFNPQLRELRTAYAGVWRYLLFIGRN